MTDDEILARYVAEFGGERRKWAPHDPTPRQAEFLGLDCLEAMYGGAAGGGKSDALLMAALLHVDQPGYAALLLRRTYADLSLPGAIMDRADQWLRNTPAAWNGSEKTWRFPSGATLTFGYLDAEQDKYRYQSSEFQFIGFDELTQFTETQYRYLLSRLRRKSGVSIPLRMRSATNPGGIGHEWVKRRFVDTKTRDGRSFVPAKLVDNPHVDQAAYGEALNELDDTTRRQLKDGEWIRDGQGLVYKFDAARNIVPTLPKRRDWLYLWGIDFGSSEKKPTEAIGVAAFCYHLPAVYLVETRKTTSLTLDEIKAQYDADKLRYGGFVAVLIDQGGLGGKFGKELQERYSMPIEHSEKSNKLGYRKLLNGALQNGKLLVVEESNGPWVEEASNLMWNAKGTDAEAGQDDHATDIGLYLWRRAKAFLAVEENTPPNKGTPDRADYEAQQMFERQLDRLEREKSRAWWEKR